jgi:hypothetical protein
MFVNSRSLCMCDWCVSKSRASAGLFFFLLSALRASQSPGDSNSIVFAYEHVGVLARVFERALKLNNVDKTLKLTKVDES